MSQAYTPTLELSLRKRVSKVRELPLAGKVLVSVGDAVQAHTPVLAAELPGELEILRLADRLGFEPEQVLPGLRVRVGESVNSGDLVCEIKSFFGLFSSTVRSSTSGTVEFFTEANAHLGIRQQSNPIQVGAYIDGRITHVEEGKSVTVETEGAIVQGIFGVGGERFGEVSVLDLPPAALVEREDLEKLELAGKVLVGGRAFSLPALRYAGEKKVSAIITGSVDADTLHQFVGYEIGVSVTGDEAVPFTFVITEGFGALPMSQRVLEVARAVAGKRASVNGATQVRAGAMRPEMIISNFQSGAAVLDTSLGGSLEVGSRVRMIRVPYFGIFGRVVELPSQPELVPSGAVVRVAKVEIDGKQLVTIPRANLELA